MIKKIAFVLVLLGVTISVAQSSSKQATKLVKEVVYKKTPEANLKMHFYYPEDFKKRNKHPAIVFFFGGGWNGGSINQFKDQAKYFTTRGMVAVLVDYRVKSRHKTTPFDAVKDAKSAIRYIRKKAKKHGVDTKKIVASGGSAGGHLAAATAMLSGLEEKNENHKISSKANALVLFNPVIDNSSTGYGYDRIGERYTQFSPMHNIDENTPPTIFFLGSKDKLIPVETAFAYKNKIEDAKGRCDVFIYEGQGHGFFNKGKQEGIYYYKTLKETDLFLQSIGYLTKKKLEL